ncbi:Aspartokinase 2 [Acholeplasma oculi]|uniref:Aspartokinase n=1 Tax=Acholeplasma oculi TaxID=35623 RepID=A0A061AAU9_9MOLU|nr:aspartate kinase [Acholeplasma oculi]CDR30973.1 Aspartate kinase, monofunctional class [Acholeplasma oculi]SKC35913.1 aspartate kinase [Acholeplasma oculi]SUT90334.1 Aspartokinase 2 [Acholeplasma oculi]
MRAVLKFGGSSVATIELMKKVAEVIIKRKKLYDELIIVVSAMGKTTNQLISMAKEISLYPNKREMDLLISTGEVVSISLLSLILQEMGENSIALTGTQAGILTKGTHTKNKISDIHTEKIESELALGKIVIVAGFQGFNEQGDITTLGRGGSDTSAVALAAKLNSICEIYTDVDGIYGIDPRLYKDAKKLKQIDYEEMKEMAFLGAKVMEPRSIDIAQNHGVIVYVAKTLSDEEGTYIMNYKDGLEDKKITGIAVSDKVIMVSMKRIPYSAKLTAELFRDLAKNEVNVDVINQNPSIGGNMNIAFTAHADDLDAVNEVLDQFKVKYPVVNILRIDDVVKVSLIGSAMRTQSGIAAEAFEVLADNDLEFKLVTTSEISISYTFDRSKKDKVIEVLAKHFNV